MLDSSLLTAKLLNTMFSKAGVPIAAGIAIWLQSEKDGRSNTLASDSDTNRPTRLKDWEKIPTLTKAGIAKQQLTAGILLLECFIFTVVLIIGLSFIAQRSEDALYYVTRVTEFPYST